MSLEYQIEEIFKDKNILPSRFQIDNAVVLDFRTCGLISPAIITRIHFEKGKVTYDVKVYIGDNYSEDAKVIELKEIESNCIVRLFGADQ